MKYGHSKFSLEILEYCEAEQVVTKEQYYIDLLDPEVRRLTVFMPAQTNWVRKRTYLVYLQLDARQNRMVRRVDHNQMRTENWVGTDNGDGPKDLQEVGPNRSPSPPPPPPERSGGGGGGMKRMPTLQPASSPFQTHSTRRKYL